MDSSQAENSMIEKGTEVLNKGESLVKTITLEPGDFAEYLEITGTVRANNQFDILAEEAGELIKIKKDQGNYAKKGDTLAVIDNKILKAGYIQAEAAMKQAELAYSSNKVLFEKKAVSENDFLSSKYTYEQAKAAYKLYEARYGKLFITAPLNGLVNERFVDLGAYANSMSPVFHFIDNDTIKITAGIAERFASYIHTGSEAVITFDAFPDLMLNGKISFFSKSINPVNRTFKVEMKLKNPDKKLSHGIIANLKILKNHYKDRIIIPMESLMDSEKGHYVYVKENGMAKKIFVDIIAVYKDSVLVNGPVSGQSLIVQGHRELADGEKIKEIL